MERIDDNLPTYNQGWIEGKKDERDGTIKLIEGRIDNYKAIQILVPPTYKHASDIMINELEHLLTQLK